jgi:hypothetical protein
VRWELHACLGYGIGTALLEKPAPVKKAGAVVLHDEGESSPA